MTILIDIDDTVERLLPSWVKWLNNKYGTSVNYQDIDEWDVSIFFPSLTKEQVFEPLHSEDFWWTVEPRKDAMKYVKKLYDEGFNLYFCTSTDYRNVRVKYEAIIKRYFPYMAWDRVIIASNKQMIKADVLVDDAPHNLEGGDFIKVLMSATHNRDYDIDEECMFRAETWREIYELIHELFVRSIDVLFDYANYHNQKQSIVRGLK